jgi:hypothetical protein
MAVQSLGQSLAWITLVVVLLTCSHVPDGRAQGDGAPQASSTGMLFGRVTAMRPPGPGEGGVPGGPIPGGSSAPVAMARVGIAPVGSAHISWVVTSEDGSFAIHVPAGPYRVTLETRPGMGVARGLPATVTIEAGQQRRLDIHLDTGIRSPGHSKGRAPAFRP